MELPNKYEVNKNLPHQGTLHRDLKSANILVNAQGIAKLADFGLSKIEGRSVQTAGAKSQALPWQAPECFTFKSEYTNVLRARASL